LSVRTIWLAAGLIVFVGVAMTVWLLLAFGNGGDKQRNQLEAVKTAGTIVIGTGGAAALLLAARRQRAAELALKQKERDQEDARRVYVLQERIAATTAADADARRITDLYTKAVDQLGSDKAPVRLGGLYALERLAQDNENQRQTIVNVMCAYLRMPYQPPTALEEDADDEAAQVHQTKLQEREVRITAQRLIRDHLQPGAHSGVISEKFWDRIDLDLTGATLVDFSLRGCRVRTATFKSTMFTGDFADFKEAAFLSEASFDSAHFWGWATFEKSQFQRNASFWHCKFRGKVDFGNAIFEEDVVLGGSQFSKTAAFGAIFGGDIFLGKTIFEDRAYFSTAEIRGQVHISQDTHFAHGLPAELASAPKENTST
jgi:uncharacterized protein YjbI with pentapeptide repeats